MGSEAAAAFLQGETSEGARGCQWRSTTEPEGGKKTQIGKKQVGKLKRSEPCWAARDPLLLVHSRESSCVAEREWQ